MARGRPWSAMGPKLAEKPTQKGRESPLWGGAQTLTICPVKIAAPSENENKAQADASCFIGTTLLSPRFH